jgi:two-component system, OmpR family, sensor kinase
LTKPSRSIERRLLLIQLVATIVVSGFLAAAVALLVRAEVGRLLDQQLEEVARTVIRHAQDMHPHGPDEPTLRLAVQMWDANWRLLWRSGTELPMPERTPLGLSTWPGDAVRPAARVYTLRSAGNIVQVAHPLSVRDNVAADEAIDVLLVSLASLVILSAIITLTVRRSLRPLRTLDAELARRGAQSMASIDLPDAPQELRRPLATLNQLLDRLARGLQTHRQFVSDAAHELRTPLAAIRLQAGNVASARTLAERDAAVLQLMRGIDRAQHLVQQLLTLARFEPGATGMLHESVDLHAVAQSCLVDLVSVASTKNIELGLAGASGMWLDGDPHALRVLLDNLVGNAIKYSPAGTTVDVALARQAGGRIALSVRDQGPGIPVAARQRVFDRFYRHAHPGEMGSGLGLAIVAEIAQAHGASVDLRQGPQGLGLEVEVVFASAEADRTPAASAPSVAVAPP